MSPILTLRRRTLLRAGLSGFALPFLPSLARAQGMTRPPLRFIALQSRDGCFESQFWPAQDPQTQVAPGVWAAPLSGISGQISPVLGTAFDAHRARFSLLRGVGYTHYAFHKACGPFSCSETPTAENSEDVPAAGSSVDCILENSSHFYGSAPALRALRISDSRAFGFWRPGGGTSGPVTRQSTVSTRNLRTLMTPLLGAASGPAPVATLDEAALLDRVLLRYRGLETHMSLSLDDQQRVQAHAQRLTELRARAAATATPAPAQTSCAGLAAAPAGTRVIDRYNDVTSIIAAAFACDVTRIATLYLSHYDDEGTVGMSRHHDNSHLSRNDPTVLGNCRAWYGWQAARVASLMSKLSAITEFDGSSVLDNTVLVWANEDGVGDHHSAEGLPVLVAGGARGRLRMGQYLDFRRRPALTSGGYGGGRPQPGAPWSSGLRSVMTALGVPAAEFDRQGTHGAFGQFQPTYDMSVNIQDAANRRRQLLPYFSV
ncbi:MAG: DUF1552 domain-containing protein [Myxococcales bacterium]|nr:DUF1552 domain-containing protein [Myxococcales bacterium]